MAEDKGKTTKKIDKLIKKRFDIKQCLFRFNTKLNSLIEANDLENIKARLENINPLLEKFNEIQYEISLLDEEQSIESDIDEFEEQYYSAISKAKTKINEMYTPPRDVKIFEDVKAKHVKLPILSLPVFKGALEDWNEFYESFNSIIHSNEKLNNVEKFVYLKSVVEDEAASCISSLTISSENYFTALEILKKRFENKRVLIKLHTSGILNLPQIFKKSPKSIRQLLDKLSSHLKSLKNMNLPTNQWDILIIQIVTSKMDFKLKELWENKSPDIPTFADLENFLIKTCQDSEALGFDSNNQENKDNKVKNHHFNKRGIYSSHTSSQYTPTCRFCSNDHDIQNCAEFKKLTTEDRLKKVRSLNLCSLCLKFGHTTMKCWSKIYCKKCSGKHNTLVHLDKKDKINTEEESLQEPQPSTSCSNSCAEISQSEILLATAIVYVKDYNNHWQQLRILLDSGSQSNLITERALKRLNLPCSKTKINLVGIGQESIKTTSKIDIYVKSRFNHFETKITCLALEKITERLPLMSFNIKNLQIPSNIKLADPKFNVNNEIDMLLGSELFYELLDSERLKIPNSKLILQKTKFGYIVAGPTSNTISKTVVNVSNVELDQNLTKFWNYETVPEEKTLTTEEVECEKHFEKTYRRDQTGRFVVHMPFKQNLNMLCDSKNVAKRRFFSLESKLGKNPTMRNEYNKFMNEYVSLDHMELVQNANISASGKTFYLPHHGVLKESSVTTKLRVVFDGTIQSVPGTCLNEVLMIGPRLQEDLFTIIVRFRVHNYVLTGDITKMYRQIWIDKSERDYLRIFWRNHESESLDTYRLKTVTYGTACAPYLAIKCLQQLAKLEENNFPVGSKIINRDFYVDDMLTGGHTVEEVKIIKSEVTEALRKAGFNLTKFCANHKDILSDKIDDEVNISLDKENEQKTLGLLWNPTADVLLYNINDSNITEELTKRKILSVISQLFDPLGLLGPVIVTAKLIIQELWLRKLGWDQTVPSDIIQRWTGFIKSFKALEKVRVPRQMLAFNALESLQLHGFCDSSQNAYGACVYIRSQCLSGSVTVNLVSAKSRVAPIKSVSIPRLELCGALLLAELVDKLKGAISATAEIYLWTDSTIVLSWLKSPPNSWVTYVANRVSKIQTLSANAKWNHINTLENPADIISRGLLPQEINGHDLWWHGPHWLSSDPKYWPTQNIKLIECPPEGKKTIVHITNIKPSLIDFTRISSFRKLIRVVAFILRFINNCRIKIKQTGCLSTDELEISKTYILKQVQSEEYSQEFKSLTDGKEVSNHSKLRLLSPFLDKDKVMRVGGRLSNAALPFDTKFPIILPTKHIITKLIIEEFHKKQLHAGAQGTLAAIRQEYWIIAGRDLVRKIIHKCISCFRAKPSAMTQKMGNLPFTRTEPTRPFSVCGVDYAGPILLKEGRGRGKKSVKAYIALYVCFSSKAIHLELVSDLTTEAFLNTFKRFIARRGNVDQIYSDNAKNFVGAQRELKELFSFVHSERYKKCVIEDLTQRGIKWHFIPARTPSFGGIWESGIKSVKTHLKRVLGNTVATFEEMYTVLTSIEAILNSRPLCPLSTDPHDLTCLTPGHLLIGQPLTAPPEHHLMDIKVHTLSRWQRLEQIRQHFWSRWRLEYLHQLQTRPKWQRINNNKIEEGMLVLLIEDNVPPLQWPMGRITSLHPGNDGHVRVVSIRTKTGIIKRGIAKICILPIYD